MKPPVGLGANETFPVTFQPQKLHCQDTCRSQPNSYCNQFRLLSKLAGAGKEHRARPGVKHVSHFPPLCPGRFVLFFCESSFSPFLHMMHRHAFNSFPPLSRRVEIYSGVTRNLAGPGGGLWSSTSRSCGCFPETDGAAHGRYPGTRRWDRRHASWRLTRRPARHSGGRLGTMALGNSVFRHQPSVTDENPRQRVLHGRPGGLV